MGWIFGKKEKKEKLAKVWAMETKSWTGVGKKPQIPHSLFDLRAISSLEFGRINASNFMTFCTSGMSLRGAEF